MIPMNSGNELCVIPSYQCNSRTLSSAGGNSRNPQRYSCSYADRNGFNADDAATLRPGTCARRSPSPS